MCVCVYETFLNDFYPIQNVMQALCEQALGCSLGVEAPDCYLCCCMLLYVALSAYRLSAEDLQSLIWESALLYQPTVRPCAHGWDT